MKSTCSIVKPIGASGATNKRIPTNARYAKVGSTLDTGGNVLSAARAKDQDNVAKYRKMEHFRRFGPRTLLQYMSAAIARESMHQPPHAESPALLLLDVREMPAYEECHLPSAVPFRPSRLNHATSPFPPEVLAFRNVPNHLVVFYDWDEGSAPDVANIAFEKGIDNVAVLTGGLRFYLQFSDNVIGAPPPGVSVLTRADDGASVMTGVTAATRRTSAAAAGGSAARAVPRGAGVMSLGAGTAKASGSWKP